MTTLTDLGFSKNEISETIVSTYCKDGKPIAAPMGVTMLSDEQALIKISNTSTTHQNIRLNNCAVINITSNPELFYRTAFKETNPKGILPPEWFEKAQTVNAPQLCEADAVIEVSITEMNPIDTQRTQVTCNVEIVKAEKTFPKTYCRAFGATMEAIIHATRVKAFAFEEEKQRQINKLLRLINNCKDVVNRTAPDSQYSEILTDLAKRIDSWTVNK